jgi:glycosyltransferase involved in cell wall biosynthesis
MVWAEWRTEVRVGVLVGSLSISAGGSYTYSMNIVNHLELNGLKNQDFVLICGPKEFEMLDAKFPGSVRVYKPRYQSKLFRVAQYIKALIELSVTRKPISIESIQNWNILKVVENLSLDLIWSIEPLGFPFDIPYVTTVWDLEHRNKPFFPEVSRNGEWERRESRYSKVLGKATFIVTGTLVGKQEIVNLYRVNPERVIVAPFPVHQNLQSVSSERNPNLIFYPAQFWPHKNHANLIEAFKLSCDTEPDLKLLLVGSDRGRQAEIQRLVNDLGLNSNVEFLGTISNLELENLYQTASLMIYPSFFGPDNLPPLEAISFQCPVAASDHSGSREQFKNGIPLFDPTDIAEISQIISGRGSLQISLDFQKKMLDSSNIDSFFEAVERHLNQFAKMARNFNS